MAVSLAEYRPALLADIILDGGTQRVASKDFYDDSGNYYKGSLVEIPGIQKALSDLYYGVEETSSVTLKIANAKSNVDSTWDEIIVTGADEARGREVLIQRNDPLDGTSFELRGKITEYKLGSIVEITVETRKDYALDALLPQAVVTNDAPWTATAIDIGKAVNLCFGYCRNVPLRNIQNDRINDFYDYLIGYGTIEDLWIDHANGLGVKRDGVLVNVAEYGQNAPNYDNGNVSTTLYAGYAVIRFKREQMSFNGAFHNLTADVKGLELGGATAERNFANVIKNILSDATWGLNESVDAASFATAAAALPTATYMCDGAITEQRKSKDILNDLLFPSRATLTRATDGEWEMAVDVAGASVLNLGDNDGYYNNAQVVNASAMNAEEALHTAVVHYAINSVDPDTPFKEISHPTGLDFGITRTYDLSFVSEDDTAKKVLSYLTRRSVYSDKTVLLQGGMECRDISCGNVITLTAPAREISAKEYKVERISKGIASFELACREYSADIYGDEAIAAPTGQTSTVITVQGSASIVMGSIGGWDIIIGYIYSLGGGTPTAAPSEGIVLASGNPGLTVYKNTEKRLEVGHLVGDVYGLKGYASDGATVVFEISDIQQMLAGWYFDENSIADNTVDANASIFIDSANTLIRCGPTTGDYLTLDGANLRLRSSNYVAGRAGTGFTLEPDRLEVGNIAVRGIIRTTVFQKDIISAVGGTVAVSKGADVLATTMTALDACNLVIEGNETFAVGDMLRIKDGIDNEWFEITNAAGAPTYVVIRDKNGDYAADSNPTWKKGATVVNYGAANDGWIYMTASEANAPYLSVATHAGAPWTTLTTRLRIGNLNGYLDYAADTYGFAVGSSGAGEANITIDPTNGVRIRSATTSLIEFDMSGNAKISGFYIGQHDLWGGNAAIGNAATTIVLGNLDGTSKIALGPSADAITVAGTETGFIADGGGNLRVGDADSWLKWSGGALDIQLASGEALTLSAGGDLKIIADNADPALIIFEGTDNSTTFGGYNAAGNALLIMPSADNAVVLTIGGSVTRFSYITLVSRVLILDTYYDANYRMYRRMDADSNSVQEYVYVKRAGVTKSLITEYDVAGALYFRPTSNKEWDLGHASFAWDDAYADDWHNVADFYYLDTKDDLAAIMDIQSSGEIDPRTGLPLIDDATIAEWMLSRSKEGKEILRDPEGKPWLSNKMMFSVLMGSIKQLNTRLEILEAKP